MELREALSQIAEIRQHVARTEVFRGYRAVPVAFSGLLALAAAGAQSLWILDPTHQLPAYLALWIGAAAISSFAAGAEMWLRCQRSGSAWARETTLLAVGQFLPCMGAGALVTLVLAAYVPESAWLLPGLWQVLFSLGIFASFRLLPRATFWVGLFYLFSGAACLAVAHGAAALSPWVMGVPFGVGQLLAAAVLYWTLERGHGEEAQEG